jgi:hypothetical protein
MGLGAVMGGCGGSQSGKGADRTTVQRDGNDDDDMICHQEYPTGSHIGRTVCRSNDERQRERDRARELISTPRRAPPPQPPD